MSGSVLNFGKQPILFLLLAFSIHLVPTNSFGLNLNCVALRYLIAGIVTLGPSFVPGPESDSHKFQPALNPIDDASDPRELGSWFTDATLRLGKLNTLVGFNREGLAQHLNQRYVTVYFYDDPQKNNRYFSDQDKKALESYIEKNKTTKLGEQNFYLNEANIFRNDLRVKFPIVVIGKNSTHAEIVRLFLRHELDSQRGSLKDPLSIALANHSRSPDKASQLYQNWKKAEETYFKNEALRDPLRENEAKLFNDFALSYLKLQTHLMLDDLGSSLLDFEVAQMEIHPLNPLSLKSSGESSLRASRVRTAIQALENSYRQNSSSDTLKLIDRKSHLLNDQASLAYGKLSSVLDLTLKLYNDGLRFQLKLAD